MLVIFFVLIFTFIIAIIGGSLRQRFFLPKRLILKLQLSNIKIIKLKRHKGRFRYVDNAKGFPLRGWAIPYPYITYWRVAVRVNNDNTYSKLIAVKDYWYRFEVIENEKKAKIGGNKIKPN